MALGKTGGGYEYIRGTICHSFIAFREMADNFHA